MGVSISGPSSGGSGGGGGSETITPKFLSSNLTTNSFGVTDLSHSGLTVDQWYEFELHLNVSGTAGTFFTFDVLHSGAILRDAVNLTNTTTRSFSYKVTFKALTTSLNVRIYDISGKGITVNGGSSYSADTFSTLTVKNLSE